MTNTTEKGPQTRDWRKLGQKKKQPGMKNNGALK